MQIGVTDSPTGQQLRLEGSLTMSSAEELKRQYRASLEQGYVRFVVDLGGLSYVDSTGLGALIGLLKSARSRGGTAIFYGAPPIIRHIIELTRLDQVLTLCDNRAQAEQAVATPSSMARP
ncbi:MAG: STAS domain-containing protein [Chloroflexi bacterium]|nr:STAS domain-containing protein [Chloroflexota bacterium]